jgi:DNA-binding IclR family transcriptional regulator
MKTKPKLRLRDLRAALQRDGLADFERAMLAIAVFQLRGRSASANEIAEFLTWPPERAAAALAELERKGFAEPGPGTEPLS